jgi:predicted nucleic acid-binding protein
MRRILVDTNLVLDVLLDRQPHAEASAAVWAAVESGAAEGLLAAHALTTIHYLIRKAAGNSKAGKTIKSMMRVFQVAAVDAAVIEDAIQFSFADFEDAVTAAAASSGGCEFIVTRDTKGFRGSPVSAITPESALALFAQE